MSDTQKTAAQKIESLKSPSPRLFWTPIVKSASDRRVEFRPDLEGAKAELERHSKAIKAEGITLPDLDQITASSENVRFFFVRETRVSGRVRYGYKFAAPWGVSVLLPETGWMSPSSPVPAPKCHFFVFRVWNNASTMNLDTLSVVCRLRDLQSPGKPSDGEALIRGFDTREAAEEWAFEKRIQDQAAKWNVSRIVIEREDRKSRPDLAPITSEEASRIVEDALELTPTLKRIEGLHLIGKEIELETGSGPDGAWKELGRGQSWEEALQAAGITVIVESVESRPAALAEEPSGQKFVRIFGIWTAGTTPEPEPEAPKDITREEAQAAKTGEATASPVAKKDEIALPEEKGPRLEAEPVPSVGQAAITAIAVLEDASSSAIGSNAAELSIDIIRDRWVRHALREGMGADLSDVITGKAEAGALAAGAGILDRLSKLFAEAAKKSYDRGLGFKG